MNRTTRLVFLIILLILNSVIGPINLSAGDPVSLGVGSFNLLVGFLLVVAIGTGDL